MIENVYFGAHVLFYLGITAVVGLFSYIIFDEIKKNF